MSYQLPSSGKVKGVFFSLGTTPSEDPALNCAKAICDLLDSTKKTALIAIYSLTNTEIVNALIRAKERGVDVRIVCDLTQSKGASMKKALKSLEEAGILVKIARKQKFCMHNKVGIFDSRIVATGSYNWTFSGSEKNDENLVILEGVKLAGQFEKYVFDRVMDLETLRKL